MLHKVKIKTDFPVLEDGYFLREDSQGWFRTGENGVRNIRMPRDKKTEFIEKDDQTLCLVKSKCFPPVYYTMPAAHFMPKAAAVLMDLDGTTLDSEPFWVSIIEKTVRRLAKNDKISFEQSDIPFVSGHTTIEHLSYGIEKYCPGANIDLALQYYNEITEYEINEILQGRGNMAAFRPKEGLKDFLLKLKSENVKIGLVTSGVIKKAMPEIVSVFKQLNLGDPTEFYDCIITGGISKLGKGYSTLGEMAAKPHPWLYSEVAKLGLKAQDAYRVIGIEDSSAGVVSLRLAGYSVLGLNDGNIKQSGYKFLCKDMIDCLEQALPIILGE